MVPDFLTIAEAARLIEKRELSPVELAESRLQRIQQYDGQINSFIHVMVDETYSAVNTGQKLTHLQ